MLMLSSMPEREIFPVESPDSKNQNNDPESHASDKRTAEIKHAIVQCPLPEYRRTAHHIRPTAEPITHHMT